jgi:excisionase family DNA binding protein
MAGHDVDGRGWAGVKEAALAIVKHYKLSEVEALLGVSRRTLKQWISDGKIKAVKLGGGGTTTPWRITESELQRFLDLRSGGGGDDVPGADHPKARAPHGGKGKEDGEDDIRKR